MPSERALSIAIEIAEALGQAHRQGIVHRDLKPGNVMLTKTSVKVLDFGLAKTNHVLPGADESASPTLSRPLTAEGSLVGTFQYMAPEQLEGREADSRSDVFALGAVLYEMVTGQKAFSGGSPASLIASVLKEEPGGIADPATERVVRKCLAKDPDARWQNADDVATNLAWLKEGAPAAATLEQRQNRLPWAVAAVAIVAAAVSGVVSLNRAGIDERLTASVLPPERRAFDFAAGPMALSPDGQFLVFRAEDVLWLYRFDAGVAEPLRGTEGARAPFWSPDGRSLGFGAEGKLKKIDVTTGSVEPVCDVGMFYGGTWNREGTILFSTSATKSISRVPDSGGEPVPVLLDDDSVTGWTVAEGLSLGEPVTVASGVGAEPWLGTAHFSVSENGRLAYFSGGAEGRSELVWFDRSGTRLGTIGEPAFYYAPRLSHDGRRIAVDISDAEASGDVWLIDVKQPSPIRFTFSPENETRPVWSPDGGTFVFEVGRSPSRDIWAVSLPDGTAHPIVETTFDEGDAVLSPTGGWLAYESNESGRSEIYVQAFPEPRGKRRVSTGGGSTARWSPRGDELFFLDLGGRLMAVDVVLASNLEVGAPRALFSIRVRFSGHEFDVSANEDRFLVNTLLAEKEGAPITVVLNWTQALERP